MLTKRVHQVLDSARLGISVVVTEECGGVIRAGVPSPASSWLLICR
jgi:hypothetical protein